MSSVPKTLGRKGRKATMPGNIFDLPNMVDYDPDTGAMSTIGPYSSTGTVRKDGYTYIRLPDRSAHMERGGRKTRYVRVDHIAWFLSVGEWPTGWMEHVNGLRPENNIENLVHMDAEGVRWWMGRQSVNQPRQLVMVDDVTFRVIEGDKVTIKPQVAEGWRTADIVRADEPDPQEEDMSYPKGEFGVDWGV